MNMSAELQTKNLENKLKIFSSGLGDIFYELIKPVGEQMTREAKSNTSFNNRTGRLFNSINFIFDKRDMEGALTTRKRLGRRNMWYANIREHGAFIQAKNADYLTFKVNGEWKKVKSVRTPAQPFMRPVFDDYFGNNGKGFKMLADELMKRIEQELY